LGKNAKSEGRVTVATLSTDLKVYARQRWPLDKDSRRKERLASLLNLTVRRVRSLWENEQTASPRGDELERIEALIGAEREAANAAADRALEARISELEAQLAAVVAALAGDKLAAHSRAARGDSSDTHSAGGRTPARRTTDRK
jgi:hypothetical protein